MGYYTTFLEQVVTKLRAAGVDATIEYPNRPIPCCGTQTFCTVALQRVHYDAPIRCRLGGKAFSVTLGLRIKLMTAPERGVYALTGLLEQTVLPLLSDGSYRLTELNADTPFYDKDIGKLVLQTECTLDGLVMQPPMEEDERHENRQHT